MTIAGTHASRCTDCRAPLAPEQRYCLECGARRGPMPGPIAERLAASLERGRPVEVPDEVPSAAPDQPGDAHADGELMPADERPAPRYGGLFGPGIAGPRQAAFAVLGVLAFGVFIGSFGPTRGLADLAQAPLLVVLPHASPSNSSPSSSGGGGGGGGGGSSNSSGSSSSNQPSQSNSPSSGGSTGSSGNSTGNNTGFPSYNGLPPIPHFFLIVLSGQDYNQTFGPIATNAYFSKTLPKEGELLVNYYSVATSPLANEIAIISGQGPTPQTVEDCPRYGKLTPGTKGAHSQVLGNGCVYPTDTKTLAGQFTAAHDTWKAYVQGIGSGSGEAAACDHPALGARGANGATPKRPYATWTNPFVYFASLTRSSACKQDDVGLAQLKTDLASASTTPSFAYIVPSPCDDGATKPCAPHAAAGLEPAAKFLEPIVNEIKASAAYKEGGMIAITFDNAPQTGPNADQSSCCNNPSFPNLPAAPATSTTTTSTTASTTISTTSSAPTTSSSTTSSSTTSTTTSTTGTATSSSTTTSLTTTTTSSSTSTGDGLSSSTGGGGHVGLMLISPWVKPGTEDLLNYFDHFSLLASVESLFGLGHLGYASLAGLQTIPVGDFNGTGPS